MTKDNEEERLALRRLGTGEDAVRWLIGFIELDLQFLSSGQIEDLSLEIRMFSIFGGTNFGEGKFGEAQDYVRLGIAPPTYLPEWRSSFRRSKEKIKAIQKTTTSWLHQVANKKRTSPITLSLEFSLVNENNLKGFIRTTSDSSLADSFYFHALRLFSEHYSLIRICECKKIFFAERAKQKFCTLRCSRKAAQKEFQKRKKVKGKLSK